MSGAVKRIAALQAAYQEHTVPLWRDLAKEFVIEMVRGLDEAAFAFRMAPNSEELRRSDASRHYRLMGAASALRPFLEMIKDDERGVPWSPTSAKRAELADRHLENCGRFAMVLRVAQMEWFGLAKSTFVGENRLVIEAMPDDDEHADVVAAARVHAAARHAFKARQRKLIARKAEIGAKLAEHVWAASGWFIGYDGNEELKAYHQEYARIRATGIAEAEALPGGSLLGGRTFERWNDASLTAFGTVMQHIAFATKLRSSDGSLELRNLLTVFARKDDLEELWESRVESSAAARAVMAGLTLDAAKAARCERDHEIPLPYYVDLGRHFALLPVFGGLQNPCAGMVWHLRQAYEDDWNGVVDHREAVFRKDLQALFTPPRYIVPDKGLQLYRPDGSKLTDIDALVLDRSSGDLVLVQLKWPNIHGRSLAERNSRRLNLLDANRWVEKVSGWIAGRSAGEIAAVAGLGDASRRPPVLLVLPRYSARFTGEDGYDPRARWMTWPALVEAFGKSPRSGIVSALRSSRDKTKGRHRTGVSVHELPGLTVEVRTCGP